jgi:hypothetical protein
VRSYVGNSRVVRQEVFSFQPFGYRGKLMVDIINLIKGTAMTSGFQIAQFSTDSSFFISFKENFLRSVSNN